LASTTVYFMTATTQFAVQVTEDNAASRDFLSKLPMTVEFQDFHGMEKIAFPEVKIDTAEAPGMTAQVGDFFCYAPWGNFGFFYKPMEYSADNVRIGTTEDLEAVLALDGQRVTISVGI